MNVTFWVLMVLMLFFAIAAIVFPLLKARQVSSLAYKDSNLKINEEKLRELDLDLAEGRIDREYYQAAREELDRELLVDIPQESKETASEHYSVAAERRPAIALMISVFIPAVAMLLYLDLGMHSASEDDFIARHQSQQGVQQAEQQPSVEEMTRRLQQKIDEQGGSVEEWIMLGRAHKYLGENELAANAFRVALEQDTQNAQLKLELAEVLALENDRQFTDESRKLVMDAMALEPENPNVLWFAGVAEFQSRQYRQAIAHLTKLLPFARGDEEVIKSIITIVAQSRDALVAAGEKMPDLEQLLGIEAGETTVSDASTPPEKAAATDAVSLQVKVDVSDEVKAKFTANDTVFVYAKAVQGPRMPLAVQRLTLASLPATVVLDDSMAMVAGMNLSAFDRWVVSARVSHSGSAIAQSGDYIGQLNVSGDQADSLIDVTIDQAVP